MATQHYFKLKHTSRGVTLIEFAIAAITISIIVLGLIDLFRYLYLANILDARAHRALEVASWVPGLEEPAAASSGEENGEQSVNQKFANAVQAINRAAIASEVSSLFSNSDPHAAAYIPYSSSDFAGSNNIVELQGENDAANRAAFDESASAFTIALPSVSDGSRELGFVQQPIGVKITGYIKPLTPFLSPIVLTGEAWGYRETLKVGNQGPMLDCLGSPFDPNNVPTREECGCEDGVGVNQATGRCNCPPGKVYGFNPLKRVWECTCDAERLEQQCQRSKIDYVNCTCGESCKTLSHYYGPERLLDNSCGCKSFVGITGYYASGAPIYGSLNLTQYNAECKPQSCTNEQGEPIECEPLNVAACTNACQQIAPGSNFRADTCGCVCRSNFNNLIRLDTSTDDPSDYRDCNCTGARRTTPTDHVCRCRDSNGAPLPEYNGSYMIDSETCEYTHCATGRGFTHVPANPNAVPPTPEECICRADRGKIVVISNREPGNTQGGCCNANLCAGQANVVLEYGSSNNPRLGDSEDHHACQCNCAPGYKQAGHDSNGIGICCRINEELVNGVCIVPSGAGTE